METSASFEARSAPSSYPTKAPLTQQKGLACRRTLRWWSRVLDDRRRPLANHLGAYENRTSIERLKRIKLPYCFPGVTPIRSWVNWSIS